jgi:hypothetical protein
MDFSEEQQDYLSMPAGSRDKKRVGRVEKMIAEHPVAHKEGHYRCSLPDLAEFMILCCTGPGYQTGICILKKKKLDFLQS